MKQKRKTILIATHNRDLASKADYTLRLSNGNIKELMPNDLRRFTNFKSTYAVFNL